MARCVTYRSTQNEDTSAIGLNPFAMLDIERPTWAGTVASQDVRVHSITCLALKIQYMHGCPCKKYFHLYKIRHWVL